VVENDQGAVKRADVEKRYTASYTGFKLFILYTQ
jgi:hypothetical protein